MFYDLDKKSLSLEGLFLLGKSVNGGIMFGKKVKIWKIKLKNGFWGAG